jgi:hypothetical protein
MDSLSSFCYNKIPDTVQLIKSRNLLLVFWGQGSLVKTALCFGSALLLHFWGKECCVLTWRKGTKDKRSIPSTLASKGANLIHKSRALMTSWLPKATLLNSTTRRLSFNMSFVGETNMKTIDWVIQIVTVGQSSTWLGNQWNLTILVAFC